MSSSDASDAGSPLRVICGPTAAGKSALAMRLAGRWNAAIVSADSRQLYRGFDIGTAKPTPDERAEIPHFGVDVANPDERWSAARWAHAADGWIADARAMGRVPVVVGGTGFYLAALANPLDVAPELDEERRARLAPVLSAMSTEELRRWTRALDPARAHLGRTQLLRAVETALLAGRRLSDAHTGRSANARPVRYLVVDPGRELLRERIARRTDAMLAAGWLDEVRRLAACVPADAIAWKATGYGILREHLEGRLTLDEARERIVAETRQYAKRQRTWFRHQLPAHATTRVHPDDPELDDRADAWWSADS